MKNRTDYTVKFTKNYAKILYANNANNAIIQTKIIEGDDIIILDVKENTSRRSKAAKQFEYKGYKYEVIIEKFNYVYYIDVRFEEYDLTNYNFTYNAPINIELYHNIKLAKNEAKSIINNYLKTQTEINTLNEKIKDEWNLL